MTDKWTKEDTKNIGKAFGWLAKKTLQIGFMGGLTIMGAGLLNGLKEADYPLEQGALYTGEKLGEIQEVRT